MRVLIIALTGVISYKLGAGLVWASWMAIIMLMVVMQSVRFGAEREE